MKRNWTLLLPALLLSVAGLHAQTTLRANLPGWAIAIGNIGLETGLSKHFTLVAEGYYSPFWNVENFRMRGYAITPEIRYYFCEKFNKHYLGLHGNYANYERLQLSKQKNIREGHAWALGLAYGHQWIFNHHWYFDLFIGVGWWHLNNDLYCKHEPDYKIGEKLIENKFGITRGGASFVYRF